MARTAEQVFEAQGVSLADCVKAAWLNYNHKAEKNISFPRAALLVAEVLSADLEEVMAIKTAICQAPEWMQHA